MCCASLCVPDRCHATGHRGVYRLGGIPVPDVPRAGRWYARLPFLLSTPDLRTALARLTSTCPRRAHLHCQPPNRQLDSGEAVRRCVAGVPANEVPQQPAAVPALWGMRCGAGRVELGWLLWQAVCRGGRADIGWQEVEIPLQEFTLTYKGHVIPGDHEMHPGRIISMGVALAGGEALQEPGAFALEIEWIKGSSAAGGDAQSQEYRPSWADAKPHKLT